MAAICLLLTIAAILGLIAAIIAKSSHRPDAGETVRDFGIGAFIAACLLWFLS
ncbi:hypothetical protein [Stackebrandtia nassauensis]|uniref:Uncharacterized protein n=1 Tax=Stackebrandtia nassauensis (strain DSM 44728 / CIP 108903 / NRRL B-16338 / NBRC 102104 / LLR-40K-21) TaxID=446470 RepID=D3Q514_STANL|nr:hypothetical protein [Stackebrandtia nassauensis]ADD44063.1 hypothetical protein Snas_4417 [Stackebrandtia nassauensis DSM 44728]